MKLIQEEMVLILLIHLAIFSEQRHNREQTLSSTGGANHAELHHILGKAYLLQHLAQIICSAAK